MKLPHPPSALPRALALLAICVALGGGYLGVLRPWANRWGSAEEERNTVLPGERPTSERVTRAISIAAPAAQVFAWVAQLGQDRAGFYSYDLLENLAGARMPRIERLEPSLQHWKVGDRLWMYPPDELGGAGHAVLLDYAPGRHLVFGTRAPGDPAAAAPSGTWSFEVRPTSERTSRLVVRSSGARSSSLLGAAFHHTVFEPVHFAMERRMLEGIRALAEGRRPSHFRDHLNVVLWAASFAAFCAAAMLVLVGVRWRRRLLGAAAAGVTFQVLTLLQPATWVGLLLVLCVAFLLWAPKPPGERPERQSSSPPSDPAGAVEEP